MELRTVLAACIARTRPLLERRKHKPQWPAQAAGLTLTRIRASPPPAWQDASARLQPKHKVPRPLKRQALNQLVIK